jgi:hypothetical protein
MTNERIGLPQGTLDLLILEVLSLEAQHGWAISERLQQISAGTVQVQQGSLYPALHRLERRGWIKGCDGCGRRRGHPPAIAQGTTRLGRLSARLAATHRTRVRRPCQRAHEDAPIAG